MRRCNDAAEAWSSGWWHHPLPLSLAMASSIAIVIDSNGIINKNPPPIPCRCLTAHRCPYRCLAARRCWAAIVLPLPPLCCCCHRLCCSDTTPASTATAPATTSATAAAALHRSCRTVAAAATATALPPVLSIERSWMTKKLRMIHPL